MNQNNNHEYEIIETNPSLYPPNFSKYPLANNPNQPLQHTNYKDLFNEKSNYPLSCVSTPVDWSTAASAMIIVTGTLLGAIGSGGIALIAAGIISVGTLLPLYWPKDKPNNQVWLDLIIQGNQLSPREVLQPTIDLIMSTVQELKRYLDTYQYYLEQWKINKTNPSLKEELLRQLSNISAFCYASMARFSITNYEVILLPAYASVATHHIVFLHEALQYAEEWGIAKNVGDSYRGFLSKIIQEYTNYCEKWYRTGLQQLKNTPSIAWESFNNYRREYTLSVLNLISTFQRFDPRYYSNNMATQMEFTQKLYTTTPEVYSLQTPQAIDLIERALIPLPNLFTQLGQLKLYTFTAVAAFRYLQGITTTSYLTNSYTNPITSSSGNIIGTETSFTLDIANNAQAIYYGDIFHHIENPFTLEAVHGIRNINFNVINKYNQVSTLKYDSLGTNTNITESILPFTNTTSPITEKNYKYILSDMKMFSRDIPACYYGKSKLYAFIWTHSSVNIQNTINSTKEIITSDNQRKTIPHITQISAVKAYYKYPSVLVTEGPGHTGGNLVEFKNALDLISINLRFTDSARYRIRIRFASEYQSVDARLRFTNLEGNNEIADMNITLKTTPETILNQNTVNNPQYQNFNYYQSIDIIRITTDPNLPYRPVQLNLIIGGDLSGKITLIDKIEFIPVT
ncbi:insecticidal delta-endotoxin Cry8Ea1 family protein [Bacillus thuringiensis]|uniref:insecticidal delta-endotoxin Cry8Ea1 family protein n=1 Tax=Bacillus thuringiensis TaxID=1428 RepID=UPI002AB384BB|nr:insecticidal delta-endotoxin Cry8Ea1 family protein [Bacillus thuringiensis]MDY7965640.1 insecticidal delta-endotoxin Cry8Ea1 family protein [Bacillus thuringiensis]